MNEYVFLFILIICLIDIYIYYDFFKDSFEVRAKANVRILILLFFSLLLMCLNGVSNYVISLSFVLVLYYILNVVLFKAPLIPRIYFTVFFYTIDIGVEIGTLIAFSTTTNVNLITIYNYPHRWFIVMLLSKMITFFIFQSKNIINVDISKYIDANLFHGIFCLPIASFVIFMYILCTNMEDHAVNNIFLLIGCFLLVLANLFIFYFVDRIVKMMYYTKELELFQMKTNMENSHYKELEKVNQEHMKYMHNMKHYLATIAGLAQNGDTIKILNIMNEMEIEINHINKKTYCNHVILNALLCERESKAKKLGIKFNITIEPTIYLNFITDFDLINMFGNLIDNAIEATSKCEGKKYIQIDIFNTDGQFIMFRIENSFRIKPEKVGPKYVTTKKDKLMHGIGIENVKQVAQRYGGILYINFNEDECITSLSLAKNRMQME